MPMPTYEYECLKCKKGFEYFQSMKDDALKTCPKEACQQKTWGKGSVRRKLSAGAGFIFKGSGFYITDYRSEGYKEAAKKDSESAKPAPTASSESGSKPAASESKPKTSSKDKKKSKD